MIYSSESDALFDRIHFPENGETNEKRLIFISIILLIVISFTGQTMAGTSPWAQYSQYIPRRMPEIKRHLRVWISTVLNLIGLPPSETRDLKNESERIQKCKKELVDILDRAVSMNMNAVFSGKPGR